MSGGSNQRSKRKFEQELNDLDGQRLPVNLRH